jgi:DNA repair photolyase
MPHPSIRGRGAAHNPPNRFDHIEIERERWVEAGDPPPETQFFKDTSRSIIARNDSPDVGFEASVNPYRGCDRSCAYCYARPTHEYFGLSAGLDFETKIFVKEDAPELLRKELASPRWKPQVLVMSGVTDPYQSAEKRFRITRGCLEVLAEYRNPVAVITKSHLVTRDADLLGDLARDSAAVVNLSITSLRNEIQRAMEPRAATPARRLDAIRRLTDAGVPCGVMVGPVIPGLTDHEMPEILKAAAEAGAIRAGYIMLRLPHAVKELFDDWLERHFPDRRRKVLSRLKDLRGGNLYDSRYGIRMRGEGPFADQVERMFEIGCRRAGLNEVPLRLSTDGFRRPVEAEPVGPQLGLF